MLPDRYPALVAVHTLCMVAFFSGTFHVLRVLVRHGQAVSKQEPERSVLVRQCLSMGRTPLYLIAWPSLLLLVLTGGWMVWLHPALLAEAWVQAKLGLAALLFAYHVVIHRLYRKLCRDEAGWGPFTVRIWAQGAVLMLIVAVFLSTFKHVDWYIGVLGLLVLAVLLYTAVRSKGDREHRPDKPPVR